MIFLKTNERFVQLRQVMKEGVNKISGKVKQISDKSGKFREKVRSPRQRIGKRIG